MSDDLTIPRPVYGGARRNRGHSRIEPGTRRLLVIAGALAGGLVVVLGASSLMRRHSGEVPVVQADNRPIRVKPENPGGLQVANANNEIFSGADGGGSKLGPEAELPDPKALRAPPASPASAAGVNQGSPAAVSTDGKPVRPAPLVADPSAARSAPSQAAKLATTAAPAAVPDKRPATPPAQPATAEKHSASSAAGKGAIVQLAALGSEDAAKTEWQTLMKRMPDVLNGHQPSFSKVERDGRTFWRVRTSGFADVAQAKSFCERVRTKGGGCSVADF